MLCGLPAFLVAILLFTLPESPKFLACHGKPNLALKVISQIYARNKGVHYTSFPVRIKKQTIGDKTTSIVDYYYAYIYTIKM